jgi:N-acetylglucosamine kinase-like BadF-type ATPase
MTPTAPATLRILAVDGGQSAIRLRHSDRDEGVEVPGISRGGDTTVPVGEAVERGWIQAGRPVVDRAVLGLTTAPANHASALALAALVGDAIRAREVWVADDAVTSHAGALSMGPGVSLVAGTGVACLALPGEGEPRILGGHGFLLGDEGGAYWIGREGLRAVLRAREGREAPTALEGPAVAIFGDLAALHVRLHDDPRPVNTIAHFAPHVLALAAADGIARRIVKAAARELSGIAGAGARLVRRTDQDVIPVALGGRLLSEPGPLRAELDALLASDATIAARTADLPALEGAMLLGRQADPGRYGHLVTVWRAGAA